MANDNPGQALDHLDVAIASVEMARGSLDGVPALVDRNYPGYDGHFGTVLNALGRLRGRVADRATAEDVAG